jgi:hypothetical protein
MERIKLDEKFTVNRIIINKKPPVKKSTLDNSKTNLDPRDDFACNTNESFIF